MIPQADIIAWRRVAPWPDDAMVEQDLVLSRALVEIFSDAALAHGLALRGGTALHKLVLAPPSRYSEDLDFVQVEAGPIGAVLTPQLTGVEDNASLPYASSLCGACYDACPVKIDIPTLLVHLRARHVEAAAAAHHGGGEAALMRVTAWATLGVSLGTFCRMASAA